MVYVHVVWCFLASDFFGPTGWVNQAAIRSLHSQDWGWSWLFYIESPTIIVLHQCIAIGLSAMMMAGLLARIAVPLAWWFTLMVCHRMTGALFGLDQVIVMLSMYLMFSHCSAVWSIDAILNRKTKSSPDALSNPAKHAPWWLPSAAPTSANRVSTRLIQLHLCVIYLFGGLSKMRGEMWFDGSALWFTAVNFEYQSMDITWIGHATWLVALLTGLTIFWETFYCAIVWPRMTRPIALAMAVFVHGGIAAALGMITFGSIMIIANLAFIPPQLTCSIASRFSQRLAK